MLCIWTIPYLIEMKKGTHYNGELGVGWCAMDTSYIQYRQIYDMYIHMHFICLYVHLICLHKTPSGCSLLLRVLEKACNHLGQDLIVMGTNPGSRWKVTEPWDVMYTGVAVINQGGQDNTSNNFYCLAPIPTCGASLTGNSDRATALPICTAMKMRTTCDCPAVGGYTNLSLPSALSFDVTMNPLLLCPPPRSLASLSLQRHNVISLTALGKASLRHYHSTS